MIALMAFGAVLAVLCFIEMYAMSRIEKLLRPGKVEIVRFGFWFGLSLLFVSLILIGVEHV